MDYSGAQWPRGVQHLPFRNWESSKRGMPLLWRGNTPRHAIFECPACTDLRSVAQGASRREKRRGMAKICTNAKKHYGEERGTRKR
ncbi:jg22463 [Pararge aegeria aegeria]|uniref:Jg22463 protein n=1 Tax=Pararge aegeria aegeria TaxID=348720 RepID=A0A8S4SEY7_9NEOP|nr:jg22463 [Pararge aegeria aegeria]